MTPPGLWHMHGLLVRCDGIDLPARRADGATSTPDLVFVVQPPRDPDAGPDDGELLSEVDLGPMSALRVTRRVAADGRAEITALFRDLAVASVDPTLSRVSVAMRPGTEDLAPVLIAGTLISIVLTLRGHPVLHASSVVPPSAHRPGALAFVGSSGMGKSTLATLLCRDGAQLLGDDVLRTDVTGPDVLAWPGATATRLRPKAHSVGVETGARLADTADGRTEAHLPLTGSGPVPLRALLVPRPDRSAQGIAIESVEGAEAILTLTRFPRILGWRDPVTTAQALAHWGSVLRSVPLLEVTVPWGLPFRPGLGKDIVDAVATAL